MPFDLSPPYIFYFLTVMPIGVGWLISIRRYIQTKYLSQLYLTGIWFCFGFFYWFNVFGYIFESTLIILLCTFVWIPEAFIMVLFLDSISRESVDPWKICGAASLSTFLLCTAWSPDAITSFPIGSGLYGWDWGGNFKLAVYLQMAFTGLLYFYYCTKIYRHSPRTLKRHAFYLCIGAMLIVIIPLILIFTNVYMEILGIEAMVQGIGIWISAHQFARNPQLIFVLPFNVSSLTVMNSSSGLPVFTYRWDRTHKDFNEMLFSGMVQGIGGILNEAMHQGEVREVRMSQGIILLHHAKQYNLAFVMASTKTSTILHTALDAFAQAFIQRFSSILDQFNIVDAFKGANELIPKFFPFIPVIE